MTALVPEVDTPSRGCRQWIFSSRSCRTSMGRLSHLYHNHRIYHHVASTKASLSSGLEPYMFDSLLAEKTASKPDLTMTRSSQVCSVPGARTAACSGDSGDGTDKPGASGT